MDIQIKTKETLAKERYGTKKRDLPLGYERERVKVKIRTHPDYYYDLSPEEKKEYRERQKEQKENTKYWKEEKKRVQKLNKENIALAQRELAVLEYMSKTGVLNYHHGQADYNGKEVLSEIEEVKKIFTQRKEFNLMKKNREPGFNSDHSQLSATHKVYHPYIWNYQDGDSYMSRCLLGKLWRHSEFKTIYDVPLDGTWTFYAYDAGERGLGSFSRISAHRKEEEPKIRVVNPGLLRPITLP